MEDDMNVQQRIHVQSIGLWREGIFGSSFRVTSWKERITYGEQFEQSKLEFNPATGKLEVQGRSRATPDYAVNSSLAREGFFAGCFHVTPRKES